MGVLARFSGEIQRIPASVGRINRPWLGRARCKFARVGRHGHAEEYHTAVPVALLAVWNLSRARTANGKNPHGRARRRVARVGQTARPGQSTRPCELHFWPCGNCRGLTRPGNNIHTAVLEYGLAVRAAGRPNSICFHPKTTFDSGTSQD
ncbi:unnamed protein product [Linum trigynum]|uniref:Uncharacterized protein n=1 Tax=Linum trigynum TaxID=586398 RepID=A0AAV2DA15_9ROSI